MRRGVIDCEGIKYKSIYCKTPPLRELVHTSPTHFAGVVMYSEAEMGQASVGSTFAPRARTRRGERASRKSRGSGE